MSLKTVYSLLQDELSQVNNIISEALLKDSGHYTKDIVEYVIENQGKQVRPLLVLLIFKSLLPTSKPTQSELNAVLHSAAAIELIHIASLIHDDIIDHANERRSKPSLNTKWGTESALVIGVYFYSTALKLMASSGILELVDSLGHSVKAMCEGELDQLSGRDNFSLTLDEYTDIIKAKTAVLFATAAVAGALPLGISNDIKEAIRQFGLHLGSLFQLTDDYLDLFGDGTALKKKMGQDFYEGQFTLPFIMLRDSLAGADLELFVSLWKTKPEHAIVTILQLIQKTDVKEQCVDILKFYYEKTLSELSCINESSYKKGLVLITDLVLERAIGSSSMIHKAILKKMK